MPVGPGSARNLGKHAMRHGLVVLSIFIAVVVGLGMIGALDFEFWARERAKPSPHYLGPPQTTQRPFSPAQP